MISANRNFNFQGNSFEAIIIWASCQDGVLLAPIHTGGPIEKPEGKDVDRRRCGGRACRRKARALSYLFRSAVSFQHSRLALQRCPLSDTGSTDA